MIVGVDEAGRGPLAGPVVAAAVVLCDGGIEGLDDSKKLSAKKREALEIEIKARCHWAVGLADVAEIDSINILQATMLAMTRAVEALGVEPGLVMVDGSIHHDAPYPSVKRAFPFIMLQLAEYFDEGLLEEILGHLAVPDH